MMDEDEIQRRIDIDRGRAARAKIRHDVTGAKYDYFDKGYYLGRTHALEELLDDMRDGNDDA